MEFGRLIHRSNFQKSLSLGENGPLLEKIPYPFYSKNKNFSRLKQIFKAGVLHIKWKENANSAEFHRTLASKNVDFLTKDFFIRMWFFTKIVNCLRNWWSDWFEFSPECSQQNLGKLELEKRGSHLRSAFQKTPNCFSFPPHSINSNIQQWMIRILCRLLAKQFLKSILQNVFPHEWFQKDA